MNSTSLTYIGKVDIKIGRKTYSGYNSGNTELFKLLARFLAGETIDPIALPSFIKVERREKGTSDSKDIVFSPMVAITQAKQIGTEWATVISTVLTDSNIITDNLVEGFQYDLILYDHSLANKLASIEISDYTINQILTGRQALIEWSLYITNKGVEIK